MTALEIVRLIGGEFDNEDDETIEQWVELVSPYVSKKKFGKFYDQAIAYLVCHFMKMSGKGDDVLGEMGKMGMAAGAKGIGSISDGGSSISFTNPSQAFTNADTVFSLTTYGQQYLALLRLVIVPITIDH